MSKRHGDRIERHHLTTDLEYRRDELREYTENLRAAIAGPALPNPVRDVVRIEGLAHGVLTWGAMFSPEDQSVLLALRAYAAAKTALCQMADGEPGQQVTVRFEERLVALPRANPQSADAVVWVNAWYASLIGRDAALLDALAGVPERALRASATRVDAYQFPWRRALVASRSAAVPALAAIEETLATAAEATLPLAAAERALVPALAAIVRQDESAFNDALRAALLAHKKYWGKRERDSDDRAIIALGPLALACMAFDRGLRTVVESDYLVPYLIERRFDVK